MRRRYSSGTKCAWMSIVVVAERVRVARTPARFRGFVILVRCLIASSCLIYNGDLFDRKLRGDLGTFFRDDHHFFKSHAPLQRLTVLRFQSEAHSWFDFDRKVEGINPRDDRRVVLRK